LRTAIRIAWVSGTFALVLAVSFLAFASFTVGSVGAWPREALMMSLCAVLAIPAWLSGLVFLTNFMDKALYGPAGRSRLKVALVVAVSWLFMLLLLAAVSWPTWSAEWDHPSVVLMAAFVVVSAPCLPWALARSSLLQRRYHEEWGRLPIEVPS
jgi:hypothetical protein